MNQQPYHQEICDIVEKSIHNLQRSTDPFTVKVSITGDSYLIESKSYKGKIDLSNGANTISFYDLDEKNSPTFRKGIKKQLVGRLHNYLNGDNLEEINHTEHVPDLKPKNLVRKALEEFYK